ncbi:hypothetical protein [Bauldia litoralis]|uniref:hypothetical protein n=1 Tax=Bauldia litoralis TaxID=665467 RepID=UPI0032661723
MKSTRSKAPTKPCRRTPVEEAAVEANLERRRKRIKPPKIASGGVKDGQPQVVADHPDPVVWQTALEQTFGTVSYDAASLLVTSANGIVQPDPGKLEPVALNAILGLIHGINPTDEIEGMLASQMVGLHRASMDCMRRAQLAGQTFEGREMNLKHAAKLSRCFASQVEALNRHRGKGQQKVTVEHVHVHDGGQAIVGNVENPGGGSAPKSEGQPHAKQIAHAPQPAMPSQIEAERATVPVTGGQG